MTTPLVKPLLVKLLMNSINPLMDSINLLMDSIILLPTDFINLTNLHLLLEDFTNLHLLLTDYLYLFPPVIVITTTVIIEYTLAAATNTAVVITVVNTTVVTTTVKEVIANATNASLTALSSSIPIASRRFVTQVTIAVTTITHVTIAVKVHVTAARYHLVSSTTGFKISSPHH